MVFVRDVIRALDSAIARSRKLPDQSDSPYYIMYKNIGQAGLGNLKEMGVLGQPVYLRGKTHWGPEGWEFEAGQRGHEYAFYPVDFGKAEYCSDQLDRIATENKAEGLKRWKMSVDEILTYGRKTETTDALP